MDTLNVTGYQRRPPLLVGEQNGFFAREGLQVNFHQTTYAPEHNRGMAEGRWDLTLSSADTMIARTTTDGVDYLLFMQAEEGLSAYLIGQPNIQSIEQLRGKLLAGDPGDSNLDLIRKKILRQHGMDDTEYQIDIIGSSPKRRSSDWDHLSAYSGGICDRLATRTRRCTGRPSRSSRTSTSFCTGVRLTRLIRCMSSSTREPSNSRITSPT